MANHLGHFLLATLLLLTFAPTAAATSVADECTVSGFVVVAPEPPVPGGLAPFCKASVVCGLDAGCTYQVEMEFTGKGFVSASSELAGSCSGPLGCKVSGGAIHVPGGNGLNAICQAATPSVAVDGRLRCTILDLGA